jgi:type I restriction enzyme S subunit
MGNASVLSTNWETTQSFSDWQYVLLSSIFRLTSGTSRPVDVRSTPDNCHAFPVYGGNGVLGYSDQYFTEQPTVVIGRVGEKCGCVHTAPAKSWISDNALYARDFLQPIDLSFLAYVLESLDLNRLKRKSSQPLITQGIIYELAIPWPALPEQKAIAEVLRTVQRAKEATEKVIAACRQLKQSLMRHLFTYGPVPFDQADKVPLKETEIGPMPEHWELTTLGQASELFQYGTSERCHIEPTGLPVLRIPNVIGNVIDTAELKYLECQDGKPNNLLLHNGDLLFVRTNGRREYVGRCAVYDGTPERSLFASYLIRVRPRQEVVQPHFVQMYSTTEVGRSQLSGRASGAADGKFNINTQTLKAVAMPLPPMAEQSRIVQMVQGVQQATYAEVRRHQTLTTLFNTLLHHLMTGKVRLDTPETSSKAEAKR